MTRPGKLTVMIATGSGLLLGSMAAWAQNMIVRGTTTSEQGAFLGTLGGNVGIGTTTPGAKLEVNGTFLMGTGQVMSARNPANSVETWMWPRWSDNVMYTNFALNGWNIRSKDSGPVMFMAPSGNVGIGNIAPNYKLHVTGDITGNWHRSLGMTGWYSETYGGGIYMSDTSWLRVLGDKHFYTQGILSGGGLSIAYGGAAPPSNGAIIAGRVGIGTNTPNPGALLDVAGAIFATHFRAAAWHTHIDGAPGYGTYINWFSGNNLIVGNGTGGGYGPIYAGSFNVSSSRTLKEDIRDAHYGLAEVSRIRPTKYRYLADPKHEEQLGFIAEEMAEIVPEIVARDERGRPRAIDYSKLTPVLVGAIQELKRDKEDMARQLKQLQLQVERLQKR